MRTFFAVLIVVVQVLGGVVGAVDIETVLVGNPGNDNDNRPVNYVSFWDAARFSNWLHNGQGSGDTESGAYVNIGNQTTFARQAREGR